MKGVEFRMDKRDLEQEQETLKLPYSPPTLKVIELATDEVLGTGCKTLGDVVPTAICGASSCGTLVGS